MARWVRPLPTQLGQPHRCCETSARNLAAEIQVAGGGIGPRVVQRGCSSSRAHQAVWSPTLGQYTAADEDREEDKRSSRSLGLENGQ